MWCSRSIKRARCVATIFLSLHCTALAMGTAVGGLDSTAVHGSPSSTHNRLTEVLNTLSQGYIMSDSEASKAPHRHPSELVRCINEVYQNKGMSLNNALQYDLGAVKAIGSWWSRKNSSNPITLITQVSVGRLGQLEAQCRSWAGPLSTVVYTSVIQEPGSTALTVRSKSHLVRALHQVAAFLTAVEAIPSMCVLDLTLVYEVFTDRNAAMLYPFNILRNLARLQARTPVLAMLDGDLVISDSLSKILQDKTKAAEIVNGCSDHTVFVLPVFAIPAESEYNSLAKSKTLVDRSVKMEKEAFVQLVQDGIFSIFDVDRYVRGQASTMTEHWYSSTEAYTITAGQGYEPYILVDRIQAPFHDSRFRGYGSDKVSYISSIKYAGFEFRVHPDGWVIHRPHPKTKASDAFFSSWNMTTSRKLDGQEKQLGLQLRYHVSELEGKVNKMMESGSFMPTLDPAAKSCMASLTWWNDQGA